jgi:hypothetical protein
MLIKPFHGVLGSAVNGHGAEPVAFVPPTLYAVKVGGCAAASSGLTRCTGLNQTSSSAAVRLEPIESMSSTP